MVRRGRAHECSDMRGHVKGTLWLRCYEESKRTHDASSEAVNLCTLLKIKGGSIAIQEVVALRAEDVGHLEGRPRHFYFLRR